ncbi:MAG: PaaI family thioesterase [Halocynthiibacter sp.]
MEIQMREDELTQFLAKVFPQAAPQFEVLALEPMKARVRLKVTEDHLRPGGTVSGPSMFALADVSMYIAVLAMIGPKALAVTTNLNIDFMRKPVADKDLIGVCTLHKLGKSLAVGDVLLYSEGSDKVVARASSTYSLPQNPAHQGIG